jgi:DNA helicase HerA-like ATPase
MRNMVGAFEQFTNVKYNRFKTKNFISRRKLVDDFIFRRIRAKEIYLPFFDITLYRSTSVLNTEEVANVFHFPNKDIQTPNIVWLHARRSTAPVNLPDEGLYLGKSVFRGVEKKVHIAEDDRRRHFYIIGQTGTGKSKLMFSMALQDIKAGRGVAVIDPHGSDLEELLEKIPPERIDDVILFDAADTERPLGLNLLEAKNEDERHMLINAFIALLYKLYDPNHQGIMGPQLERAIRNVMLTAMEDPQSTMVDVLRLLIDDKYSQKFIPLIKDPLVKKFWTDEMAKTTANRKGEMMGYFVSKFDRLVTEKLMRNIIGQPKSSIDFHKIMAEKKILLVDLSKGKIGEENSNFLGLLLVPRILSAALSRASAIGQDFPDFYLYVDEFQNFATPDFATILSEARKYKLSLTVAHQFIAQLTDEIKDAVFGNVGTLTAFRVGPEDAEFLETQFAPTFTKSDLPNLPVGNCYIKLLVKGQPTVPFSMATDWEMIKNTPKDPNVAAKIREMSRMKYGTPAAEVEAFINLRAGAEEQVEPETPDASLFKAKIPF